MILLLSFGVCVNAGTNELMTAEGSESILGVEQENSLDDGFCANAINNLTLFINARQGMPTCAAFCSLVISGLAGVEATQEDLEDESQKP